MTATTKADRLVLGFLVFVLTGSLLFFFPGGNKFNYIDGNAQYQATLAVCYGLGGIWAIIHFRETISMVYRSKSLLALSAVVLISPVWAESSSLAFRHAIAATGTTLVGVLLAARLETTERLLLIRKVLRILCIASIFIAVFVPSYGVESTDPLHIGDWVGIYGNKNKLGAFVSIPFLIDCFMPMRLWKRAFWFSVYLLLMIKSGSASPILAMAVTGILIKVVERLRVRHKLSLKAVVISTLGTITVLIVGTFGTGFLGAIGKSTDLSGRTGLWKALIPVILEHPFLGYGYDAFWAGASAEYYTVERQIYWVPMYAHNGYLETLVSLGLLGLVLTLSFVARGAYYAFLEADVSKGTRNSFVLGLIIFYLIRNLTEATFLMANNLEWAFLVAMLLGVMPRLAAEKQSVFRAAPLEVQA